MAAGEHREIHDVEETKKMVTFITCETAFGQHVRKLVFGVNTFDSDLGEPKVILSNGQSNATLWVLDTSHRRTCAIDDHFDHRFSVFKKCTT